MSIPLLIVSWLMVALGGLLAVRLARTAARESSLPEGLLAIFFAGGVLGYAVLLLRPTLGVDPSRVGTLRGIAEICFLLPHLAVVAFTRQVFRPQAAWATALAVALAIGGVALQAGSSVLALRLGREVALASPAGDALFWMGIGVRSLGFGWATLESMVYHARARRQAALGLVDPLTANRFLLFACWSGMALVLLVLRVFTRLVVDGAGPDQPVWLVLAQLLAGLTCVATVWLTFAPPGLYRRRVLARAAR